MAWNEPGGGKDQDPWGGRGGDQGPPDLDEALRKLQGQLSSIFSGGGGGGGGVGVNPGALGLILVLAAIVYGLFGLYQVDEQERGVVFRFGAVLDDVVLPGLHWNPPIVDRVEKVNVTRVSSSQHQALMLTQDENIVDISMTAQYVIDDPVAFLTKVRNPEVSLAHATESALRHVVGGSVMDDVITEGRAAIALDVQGRLQSYLDRYGTGISVIKVNIDQSGPPKQVQDSFDDVQKAKEDEQRFINEATAYRESVVPEARGEAQRTIEEANAYQGQVVARAQGEAQRFIQLLTEYQAAKEVTRDRLYVDAMESVLRGSNKVIVDVEGGNNLLYLPLDRLTRPATTGSGASQESVRELADAIVRDLGDRQPAPRRATR